MAANAALNLPHADLGIPYTDFKFQVHKYIISNWQDEWNNVGENKVCSVKAVLGDGYSSYRWSRWDEIILCHSRIGHTFLAHSFILTGDHQPPYEYCQCILTVRHILLKCLHLQPVRDDVFGNECVMESSDSIRNSL